MIWITLKIRLCHVVKKVIIWISIIVYWYYSNTNVSTVGSRKYEAIRTRDFISKIQTFEL